MKPLARKQKNIVYDPDTDQHIVDFMNKQLPSASQYVLGLVEKDMHISKITEENLQREFVKSIIYEILKLEGLI